MVHPGVSHRDKQECLELVLVYAGASAVFPSFLELPFLWGKFSDVDMPILFPLVTRASTTYIFIFVMSRIIAPVRHHTQ